MQATIVQSPIAGFDVYHYIAFHGVPETLPPGIHTSLVTHVDSKRKEKLLRSQFERGVMPIAMSQETAIEVGRISAGYLAGNAPFVLIPPFVPARDTRLKIGIFSRLYADGRKREWELLRIAKRIPPEGVTFRIIGAGWDEIVMKLSERSFMVDYSDEFDPDDYLKALDSCDVVLYFGWDEGAISCLDALARGTRVIAPPVGFHLDVRNSLIRYAWTADQFADILNSDIATVRENHENIQAMTWEAYADQHVRIWRLMLEGALHAGPE